MYTHYEDNLNLIQEMASAFGVDNATIGEKFLADDWEWSG